MITGKIKPKVITKDIPCKCKCKFDERKRKSNQNWNNVKYPCECKKT